MANENDIVSRLILDDSDFIKKIEGANPYIDKLAANFDDLQKEVKASSQVIGKDLVQANEKAAKSIDQVTKAAIDDSKALQKQKQDISDVSNQIAKNKDQSDKLLSVYKKLTDARDKGILLDPQDLKELSDGFDKFAQEVGLSQKQLDLVQTNLGEVVDQIKLVSSDEFKQVAQQAEILTKEFSSAKSELRALTSAINSGDLKGDDLQTAIQRASRLTDEIGDTRDQIKSLASDTRALDLFAESVNGIGAGFQIAEGAAALFGDENEDLQKQLVKLNAVMAIANGLQQAGQILTTRGGIATKVATLAQAGYATVVGTSTGALKIFRIALASTGIGLLVILLGSLVANWDKVKKSVSDNSEALFDTAKTVTKFLPPLNLLIKGIEYLYNNFDKIGSAVKGAGAALQSFFGNFGDSIGKLFSGDFSGAYDSFKSIGKDARTAFDEGFAEGEKDRANKALSDELLKTVANQKKRAEILQAGGKETANIQKNILQNELKALELAGADKQEIEDKQHEISLFNAERQKILSEKAAKERERIAKQVAEATSKLKALQDELFETLSENKVLNEKEQFDIIKKSQIEAIVLAKDELVKLGKILNKDVSKEIANFDLILKGIKSRDFTSTLEPIEKLPKAIGKSIRDLKSELENLESIQVKTGFNTEKEQERLKGKIDKLRGVVSSQIKPIEIPPVNSDTFEASYTSDLEKFIEGLTDFEGLLQDSLDELFGDVGGEKAREFLGGLSTLVSEFGNILNEANELQIEAIDKQLDALSERREKSQDELDKELELQKEGLANNVSGKEKEVESLLSEEKRLTDEREKIQKEAQRRQLIADTVQQSQSLITSSINIIKGFSNIPFIGLPLGIAAVATLLGFFAKTKAQAFAATKLYTGANRIDDHFGEVGSRSDIPGRGEGYRVVDAVTGQDTNVRISGKEMLLPEDITQSQKRFFKNLKAGKYNFDIAEVLDLHSSLKESVNGGVVQQTIINTTQLPSKQWVTYTTKKGVNKAILLEVPKKGEIGSTYIFQD